MMNKGVFVFFIFMIISVTIIAQNKVTLTRDSEVYRTPNRNSEIVDKLVAGSKCEVLFYDGSYYMARLSNNKEGYIISNNFYVPQSLNILSKDAYDKYVRSEKWKKTSIIQNWELNGIDRFEGIYEGLKSSRQVEAGHSRYTLALVKNKIGYLLIYLDGAETYAHLWKEGDVKARIYPTAQNSTFKVDWISPSRLSEKSHYMQFVGGVIRLIDLDYGEMYSLMKMYPNEDSEISNRVISSGSGFFISNNGYLVTNFHVIDGSKKHQIGISINGEKRLFNAKVLIKDKKSDLAILKIDDESFEPFDEIPYSINTNLLDVGTNVFTLGYPNPNKIGTELKYTDGKINAQTGYKGDAQLYQISVNIYGGNSGGPLFDFDGNLTGIVNSGVPSMPGVNYAIKVRYLMNLIELLPSDIQLPNSKALAGQTMTEKIKILSNYCPIIYNSN